MAVNEFAAQFWLVVGPPLMGGGALVVWWLMRAMWSAIDKLREDIEDLQKSLPGAYARRDDLLRMEEKIDKMGDKISAEIKDLYFALEKHVENSMQQRVLDAKETGRDFLRAERLRRAEDDR